MMSDFLDDDVPIRPGDKGFTSFPKRLHEDCVSYAIYIIDEQVKNDDSALRDQLRAIQTAAANLQRQFLKDYIWQREPFSLVVKHKKNRSFLQGNTEFGDSLADEWVVVFLLRELSKKFKNSWVRVFDADGEFLLIEAANSLPRWLNPEISDNRVWINKGHLCIIPFENIKKQNKSMASVVPAKRSIDTENALEYIEYHASCLIKSPIIESEAFHRIKDHPNRIAESFHTSLITIPRRLAYVLHRAPAHISPAVEAFYLRDPISMKPLQARSDSNLIFPPQDMVSVSVKFTRVGFAQLKSQDFQYPACWASAAPISRDKKTLAHAEMGMKLACAFEMLMSDPQNRNKRSVREIKMLSEDLDSGEEQLPSDAELAKWPSLDDGEGWLDINFNDFEKELTGDRSGTVNGNETEAFGNKAAQENLRKVVEKFQQFLQDEGSGIEGVDDYDEMDEDDSDENADELALDGVDGLEALPFEKEELADAFRKLMDLTPICSAGPETEMDAEGKCFEDASDLNDDDGDMQELMKSMEEELMGLGALDTSSPSESQDERYALAKNLLESLCGGADSGPSANILNSFGMRLPPDKGKAKGKERK